MPDVFISYSRSRRDEVLSIVSKLQRYELDVWVDAALQVGEIFPVEIERQLESARCVLVLWTADALEKGPSGWVYSEAEWAREHGKLIQAKLEDVSLKPPFFSAMAPPLDPRTKKGENELLSRISGFVGRPGLASFPGLEKPSELAMWAGKYPRDALAQRYAHEIQRANEALARGRSIKANLRALADELAMVPTTEIAFSNQTFMDAARRVDFRAQVCPGLHEIVAEVHFARDEHFVIVRAAGRSFLLDAPVGVALAAIDTRRLCAVLSMGPPQERLAGLSELRDWGRTYKIPVYGSGDLDNAVTAINEAASSDLEWEAWGPAPTEDAAIVVVESDGLVVSAFFVRDEMQGYRFDFRGRSLVICSEVPVAPMGAVANADAIVFVDAGRVFYDQSELAEGTLVSLPIDRTEVIVCVSR